MKNKTTNRWDRKLLDARHHQTLWVKPEDIRGAVCRDHQKCAVARALQRQLGAPWVDVGASVVIVGISDKAGRRFLLSPAAKAQVRYFDTHKGAFAPCRLKLYAPPAKDKLGTRAGTKARSGKSGKRKRQPTR
jgi:hypothetical protein